MLLSMSAKVATIRHILVAHHAGLALSRKGARYFAGAAAAGADAVKSFIAFCTV